MTANTSAEMLHRVAVSKRLGVTDSWTTIWTPLQSGIVAPNEVFMKAIDRNRFKTFLPPEEEHLGEAAGECPTTNNVNPAISQSASRRARRAVRC